MRPIYYDTETTGTKSDKDRVIEIALFDPERDVAWSTFIQPGCPIPPDATAIHHITDAMVASAPTFQEIVPQLVAFCEGDTVLLAHNNDQFDVLFLQQEFIRAVVPMPNWKYIDTLKWARRYRPDLPRHTLQFLREIYQIPPNQAHRALDDVKVLHSLFALMIDDLPMAQVYQLLNTKREMTRMPFGKHQGQPLGQVPSSYVRWLKENGALDKPENQELRGAFEKLGLLSA